MANIRIVQRTATEKPRQIHLTADEASGGAAGISARTSELERLLHLSKGEMKHIEAISQVVRLWGRTDMASRDQKNKILQNLRLILGNDRTDRILDRIEGLERR